MIIRLHSVTDVITNSSTTIYTRVADGAIEALHCLIYDLTGEPADDRFIFRVTSGFEDQEDWLNELRWEYMCDLPVQDPYRGRGVAPRVNDLLEEQREAMFKHLKANPPEWWCDWAEIGAGDEDSEMSNTFIEVKARDPKDAAVAAALSNLDDLFYAVDGGNG